MVDANEGVLGIEWIDGRTIRYILPGGAPDEHGVQPSISAEDTDDIDGIMHLIGTEIAKMHLADVIHGDLTTSNMILRSYPVPEVVR